MANTTLYDLAVLNRADQYTGLIEDVTTLAPEFSTFAAIKRPGTWYEIASRTTLPSVGFRNPNSGIATSKSTYKKTLKQMFAVESIINMDEAVMKADPGSVGSLWQNEAAGVIRASSILLGQQTWYGTSADSKGFSGVRNQLAYSVAAGGTTNSTSAYLCWMDDAQGCRYDVGMDGQFAINGPRLQQVTDASSNPYMAYVGNLNAWVGFNIGSQYSAWSISGITATAGQGLTDKLVSQLVAKIPVARRSNLRLFINRTAEATLQQSRSTINPGITTYQAAFAMQPSNAAGTPAFAPLPNSTNGIPVTLTDSILDTETNS